VCINHRGLLGRICYFFGFSSGEQYWEVDMKTLLDTLWGRLRQPSGLGVGSTTKHNLTVRILSVLFFTVGAVVLFSTVFVRVERLLERVLFLDNNNNIFSIGGEEDCWRKWTVSEEEGQSSPVVINNLAESASFPLLDNTEEETMTRLQLERRRGEDENPAEFEYYVENKDDQEGDDIFSPVFYIPSQYKYWEEINPGKSGYYQAHSGYGTCDSSQSPPWWCVEVDIDVDVDVMSIRN